MILDIYISRITYFKFSAIGDALLKIQFYRITVRSTLLPETEIYEVLANHCIIISFKEHRIFR